MTHRAMREPRRVDMAAPFGRVPGAAPCDSHPHDERAGAESTSMQLTGNQAPRGGRTVTVLDWLLDSDPSVRWQVMRDLADAPADAVAAERARVATKGAGARFGEDVRGLVDRLIGEQLPDGGWNCEAPGRSTRSSFNTTICVLEALLEYERFANHAPEVT